MSIEVSNAGEYIKWLAKVVKLNSLANRAKARQIRRGEIYWCEFGLNVGSEMSKTGARPAVILQNDSANKTSSNTIVAPITHDTGYSFLVPLTARHNPDGTVRLDGSVNVTNIVCISKARLGDYIVKLTPSEMRKIDDEVSQELSLKPYYNEKCKALAGLLSENERYKEIIKRTMTFVTESDLSTELKEIFKNLLDTAW